MFGTGKIAASADEQMTAVSNEAIRTMRLVAAGFLVFLAGLFILAARSAH